MIYSKTIFVITLIFYTRKFVQCFYKSYTRINHKKLKTIEI